MHHPRSVTPLYVILYITIYPFLCYILCNILPIILCIIPSPTFGSTSNRVPSLNFNLTHNCGSILQLWPYLHVWPLSSQLWPYPYMCPKFPYGGLTRNCFPCPSPVALITTVADPPSETLLKTMWPTVALCTICAQCYHIVALLTTVRHPPTVDLLPRESQPTTAAYS